MTSDDKRNRICQDGSKPLAERKEGLRKFWYQKLIKVKATAEQSARKHRHSSSGP